MSIRLSIFRTIGAVTVTWPQPMKAFPPPTFTLSRSPPCRPAIPRRAMRIVGSGLKLARCIGEAREATSAASSFKSKSGSHQYRLIIQPAGKVGRDWSLCERMGLVNEKQKYNRIRSNQNHLPRGWPIRELTRQYLSNSVSHDKRQQDEPATRDEWGRSHENKKLRKIANVTQNSPVNTKMSLVTATTTEWWTRPSSTTGDERHAKEGGEEDGRTRGAAEEGKRGKGGDAQRRPKEADTRRRKAEEAGVWRKAKEPASKGEPRDRELKEGTWVMEVSGGMEEWGLDMRRSRSLGMDTTILEARKSSEERDRDDVDKSERNTREARKGGGGIGIEESDSDKEVASPVQRRRKRTPFVGDYEDEDGDDSKTAVASPCGETNVQEVSKTNGWPYPLDSSSLPKRFVALSEQLLVFFNSSKDLHLQAS